MNIVIVEVLVLILVLAVRKLALGVDIIVFHNAKLNAIKIALVLVN